MSPSCHHLPTLALEYACPAHNGISCNRVQGDGAGVVEFKSQRRTMSINTQEVAKVLDGVHIDDVGAMQQAAKDIVSQVRISVSRCYPEEAQYITQGSSASHPDAFYAFNVPFVHARND